MDVPQAQPEGAPTSATVDGGLRIVAGSAVLLSLAALGLMGLVRGAWLGILDSWFVSFDLSYPGDIVALLAILSGACLIGAFAALMRARASHATLALAYLAVASGCGAVVYLAYHLYSSQLVLVAVVWLAGIGLLLGGVGAWLRAGKAQWSTLTGLPGRLAAFSPTLMVGWAAVALTGILLGVAVVSRATATCEPGRLCVRGPGIVPSAGVSLELPPGWTAPVPPPLGLPFGAGSLGVVAGEPVGWASAGIDDLERKAVEYATRIGITPRGATPRVTRVELPVGPAVRADYEVVWAIFGGGFVDHWLLVDGMPILLHYGAGQLEGSAALAVDPPDLAFILASLKPRCAGCSPTATQTPVTQTPVTQTPVTQTPVTQTPEMHTVIGDVVFWGVRNTAGGQPSCLATTTTDAEIHSGTRIVLADGNGDTLGVGALEEAQNSGTLHNVDEITGEGNDLCVYMYQIEGVKTTDTYLLTVGPFPGPGYSLAQLDGVDWRPHCMMDRSWCMR